MAETHWLETKLGRIEIRPTSGKHIFLDAQHHCLSPKAADHHAPLIVNGVELAVTAHLYRHTDSIWRIGPEGNDWSAKWNALSAHKLNVPIAQQDASNAARKKITEVLEAAVNAWLSGDENHDHRVLLIQAEEQDRQERLSRALDKLASIKADLVKAQQEVDAIVAETNYAPSPVEASLRKACGTVEPDVEVQNEGTIMLFRPRNTRAEAWLHENTQEDAQWFGGALVVEHRYARDLALGMQQAGLVVR